MSLSPTPSVYIKHSININEEGERRSEGKMAELSTTFYSILVKMRREFYRNFIKRKRAFKNFTLMCVCVVN